MDKIEKFLNSLSKKERKYLLDVLFPKIKNLDFKGLDIKKIKNYPLWRIRYGKIRILFSKTEKGGLIYAIGPRKDIYKNI